MKNENEWLAKLGIGDRVLISGGYGTITASVVEGVFRRGRGTIRAGGSDYRADTGMAYTGYRRQSGVFATMNLIEPTAENEALLTAQRNRRKLHAVIGGLQARVPRLSDTEVADLLAHLENMGSGK